jgi:hypothetical protein
MVGISRREWGRGLRTLALVAGIGLAAGVVDARPGRHASRGAARPPARVVTIRQVIVRREPVTIQAVTLAQLRAELRRARLAQVDYQRQIAGQYGTIQRLQARLDAQMRQAREAESQRASQLNAQFEIILQAFGLVVFAIIGALLVALSRSQSTLPRLPAGIALPPIDWEPLQRQLGEAKNALATIESRLQRLETGVPEGSGH